MAIYPIFPGGKRKAFTLSYDDGWPQDRPLIALMNKYGLKGTFNLNSGENKFTDVADDQYYAAAVKWASANGIVNGVTETEFKPEASVTREQMAAMLARYVEFKKLAVAEAEVAYTDDADISDYAKDAVKVAGNLKILIGNANGTFAPKNNATRAEVATLFVRLLGVLEK